MSFDLPRADDIIAASLAEDLGVPVESLRGAQVGQELLARDVTSSSTVAGDALFEGLVVARHDAVVCGLPVMEQVWAMLATAAETEPVEVFPLVAEGASVDPGTVVAEVEGPAHVVLAGERTALNLLMTLSGIATEAARWKAAAGDVIVVDTRKTWPGLRALSKYAVRVGGARNHRQGLYDMVLVKDNHLRHAGDIERAIAAARDAHPDLEIEVEADSIEQAVSAASAGADIVLCDNMDDTELGEVVTAVRAVSESTGRTVEVEASGGITYERLPGLIATGIDRVSSSALTLAPPVDFGLDEIDH